MLRRQPHLQQMMTLREHALVHELQARAARAEASDFRGLVYCKEQRHCLMLAGLLRAVRGLEAFRPAMFVGHGEVAKARGDVLRARLGMSVALQVRAMNEFAAGESKLLVCTSVLEEGIDVPTCSLVIRFHALQDVTSYIQRSVPRRPLMFFCFGPCASSPPSHFAVVAARALAMASTWRFRAKKATCSAFASSGCSSPAIWRANARPCVPRRPWRRRPPTC